MPHVVVKLAAGRSPGEKAAIAEALTRAIVSAAGVGEDAVSVAIEDVAPEAWAETVYRPEILGRPETLFKAPGYSLD